MIISHVEDTNAKYTDAEAFSPGARASVAAARDRFAVRPLNSRSDYSFALTAYTSDRYFLGERGAKGG